MACRFVQWEATDGFKAGLSNVVQTSKEGEESRNETTEPTSRDTLSQSSSRDRGIEIKDDKI